MCHETSGEGETIMSASVKLLQGDSTGSVSGSLLLPLINLPLPFAAVFRHVPGVFFEIASVSTGPVSSACFSLEDHCCLQRKSMMVKENCNTRGSYIEDNERFDYSTHLEGSLSVC